MTTLEDRRGRATGPTEWTVETPVRRKGVSKPHRSRAADHGKDSPRRATHDRRTSTRREMDQPVGFLPLLD